MGYGKIRHLDRIFTGAARILDCLPEGYSVPLGKAAFSHFPLERLAGYEPPEGIGAGLGGACWDQIELEAPVILAAGYHETGILEKALLLGFPAVTAKASRYPVKGNPEPRILRRGSGIVNSVGYENPGMEAVREELSLVRERVPEQRRVIINVSESCIGNYCEVLGFLDPVADMFEINSCPNHEGSLGFYSGKVPPEELFSECRKATSRPLGLKLPRERELKERLYSEVIPAALDSGFNVLNYGNTRRVEEPRMVPGYGGLSGPSLYRDTLDEVKRLEQEFGSDAGIIGTGGIDSPERALEMLDAGASAISYMTAFHRRPLLHAEIMERIKSRG